MDQFLDIIDAELVRMRTEITRMTEQIRTKLESMITPRAPAPAAPVIVSGSARYIPDKTLKPEIKIDQHSTYRGMYTEINIKLRAYLCSGLVGCPDPTPIQVENHLNLFLDEVTRIAYIRQKTERLELTPPVATDTVSSIIDCLLEVLLGRQAISMRRKNFLDYLGTELAKGDKFGDKQLRLWDEMDRDYEGARMDQMTPYELKIMSYVCSVYDRTLRMKLMEYVIKCELEKHTPSTNDLRKIAISHWTLARETEGTGRGPGKPVGTCETGSCHRRWYNCMLSMFGGKQPHCPPVSIRIRVL